MIKSEYMKDLSTLISSVEEMKIIGPGGMFIDSMITERHVRNMILDIAYLIYFGYFNEDIKMDFESIAKAANFLRLNLGECNMWHALYLLSQYHNSCFVNNQKQIHEELFELYAQPPKDLYNLGILLRMVEHNCKNQNV